ncbi:MAG: TRAP transporter TatT component family protein [Deltaproteobacteria bacterium]|nr:TRAP transporter TatT component family protein [Deltaproteobacteria bacterium]
MILASLRNLLFPAGYSLIFCFILLLATGCGVLRRAATHHIADVFLGTSGSNVFSQDNDPELIREALPFALKTYEALLVSDPKNRSLYLSAADGFIKYANAFVHAEAERLEEVDFNRARHLQQRAAKLYLRGRNYALDGLRLDYPDFEKKLRKDPEQILHLLSEKDVPLLFCVASGWAGAISTDVNNMSLVAELPIVEAVMRRALELKEDFQGGVIHEFFITYEGSRSEIMGGSAERARGHFDRAVMLTRGKKASPYVLLASSVAVRKQDYKMFRDLLHKALAIDPDAVPEWRLANILAQKKARWLLDHSAQLFLNCEETEP